MCVCGSINCVRKSEREVKVIVFLATPFVRPVVQGAGIWPVRMSCVLFPSVCLSCVMSYVACVLALCDLETDELGQKNLGQEQMDRKREEE